MECEAKRAEARAAALKAGKSEDEAAEIAHKAAKRHWNAWAHEMLAKRKVLEECGVWAAERVWAAPEWRNTETRAWMEEAEASFSRCLFLSKGREGTQKAPENREEEFEAASLSVISIAIDGGTVDFSSFEFPGTARFVNATFNGIARFVDATFPNEAWFDNATFQNEAWFDNATFKEDCRFNDATFRGNCSFENGIFEGTAWFDNSAFEGGAFFTDSKFQSDASFDRATFTESTWFDFAAFNGDAWFGNCTFSKGASWRSAKFGDKRNPQEANFPAIKVERAFDLSSALFSTVPSFCQADFKQAPDLDRVSFPLPSRWPWRFGDPALIPKFRAIRRMAIQGADYDREQMSFKGELRSRRWTTDKPWQPGLWLGILYDVFSDCGRSIFRPASLGLLSMLAFAIFFVRIADQGGREWTECVARGDMPFLKALYVSGRNALVLSSGGKDDRIKKAYHCLFGDAIPDGVSFVESFVQVPLSAVLIFLFLLAVKNRFKIK